MADNVVETFKPDVIGGQYLVQIRAQFDKEDRSIIVASDRHIFQYDANSCDLVNKINITEIGVEKATQDDDEKASGSKNVKIASCERFENYLYIFTTSGKILIWNLETQDWLNVLALPLDEGERLISCKLISKRQYLYSIGRPSTTPEDVDENKIVDENNVEVETIKLYYSMSRSERERPKHREELGDCTSGEQNTFDLGILAEQESNYDSSSQMSQESSKTSKKSAKQRIIAFINGNDVCFQKVGIGEKLTINKFKQTISESMTCVRANAVRPMIATGDSIGRIFLFTGDYEYKNNRTKLHWHSMAVNDLAFSSTGNTLFSVGGESGCVVVWDLSQNNIGQRRIIPRLGMPIRYVNCGNSLNQLILSFEDNEIQIMDTNERTKKLRTFTRRTIDMYKENDQKALRIDRRNKVEVRNKSVGLLWHSKTDTILTNARTGWLQFYSPREQARVQCLDFLKSNILTIEREAKVIPSDITKATISSDGNWLALYETRESDSFFPDVRLHIWQRSLVTGKWIWIQTAERLHASTSIADLRFSPDGQILISLSEDGTFHVLHRVSFDSKAESQPSNKQMYAKGFAGNVPEKLPSMTAFSQDSSVLAMSLKNDTTLIWMIVDPYKLIYECQLNQIENTVPLSSVNVGGDTMETSAIPPPSHEVLGLHFGYHKPSQSLAPLCEIRSHSIRLWNILNPNEAMEYSVKDLGDPAEQFTSSAFDQCSNDDKFIDHFAVSTRNNLILVFRLQIDRTTNILKPLVKIDCSLPTSVNSLLSPYFVDMCFVEKPILYMDEQCYPNTDLVKLLNRLCLMTNYQELIAITDKLTLDRQSAANNCNKIKSIDMTELQSYLAKSSLAYADETKIDSENQQKSNSMSITEKQRRIRNRLQVQKMIRDLLIRVPSQNLPSMNVLGPMILDKLT